MRGRESWAWRLGTQTFCFKVLFWIRWLRKKRKEEGGKVARCYSWGPFNVFQRHRLWRLDFPFDFFQLFWLCVFGCDFELGEPRCLVGFILTTYLPTSRKKCLNHQYFTKVSLVWFQHLKGLLTTGSCGLRTLFPRPPWVPKRHLGADTQASGVGGGWVSRELHPLSHAQRELFHFVFYTAFHLKFNLNIFSFKYFEYFYIKYIKIFNICKYIGMYLYIIKIF